MAQLDAATAADVAALAAPLTAKEEALVASLLSADEAELMAQAAALRDQGHPRLATFSPKVFIPLTRLCRDSCGYCTFAAPPAPNRRCYMTLDEVLEVARAGAALGCSEALFTLGDKPEELYPEAAAELAALGCASTLEYVERAAAAVLRETGLLPHVNAGAMLPAEVARCVVAFCCCVLL
jgi:FO synthase